MGRPNEGVLASEAGARKIRDFQPWHGWQGGPKGTITDDTQEENSSTVRWFEGSAVQENRNGRAAPVGFVYLSDPYRIYRCLLASPEDFEQGLFTAVDAGQDADTVAAMACTLSGAYHGYSCLPQRFLDDLEHHERLIELADGLCDINRRLSGTP